MNNSNNNNKENTDNNTSSIQLRYHSNGCNNSNNVITFLRLVQVPVVQDVSDESNNDNNNSINNVNIVIYASHSIINIIQCTNDIIYPNTTTTTTTSTTTNSIIEPLLYSSINPCTLRTTVFDNSTTNIDSITTIITCLATSTSTSTAMSPTTTTKTTKNDGLYCIASGFSNGIVNVWISIIPNNNQCQSTQQTHPVTNAYNWTEFIISNNKTNNNTSASITSIDVMWMNNNDYDNNSTTTITTTGTSDDTTNDNDYYYYKKLCIITGTSIGCTIYYCIVQINNNNNNTIHNCVIQSTEQFLTSLSIASVRFSSNTSFTNTDTTTNTNTNTNTNNTILDTTNNTTNEPNFIFIGTASPRGNKIYIYTIQVPSVLHVQQVQSTTTTEIITETTETETKTPKLVVQCNGYLTGHEDWITCIDYHKLPLLQLINQHDQQDTDTSTSNALQQSSVPVSSSSLLATGSQDGRIRLWKFRTVHKNIVSPANTNMNTNATTTTAPIISADTNIVTTDEIQDDINIIDDEIDDDEDDDEEGESRLEIVTYNTCNTNGVITSTSTTSITLEALLLGHEESVTGIIWHPSPYKLYNTHSVLISSSMDRTILLWSESITTTTSDNGNNSNNNNNTTSTSSSVWVPLTRVGSAGGILGGSIGSSLLGFINVTIEPIYGTILLGHAYGGTIHVWSTTNTNTNTNSVLYDTKQADTIITDSNSSSSPNTTNIVQWKARPCITGHYRGITDLVWDTCNNGSYLLTVSNDQTCRLWAPVQVQQAIVSSKTITEVWTELIRPQVHGYDLTAITCISTKQYPHRIMSAADEKEIRVFIAPQMTIRTLQMSSSTSKTMSSTVSSIISTNSTINSSTNGGSSTSASTNVGKAIIIDPIRRVERAYIPSLGLSNKASAIDGAAEVEVEEETAIEIEAMAPIENNNNDSNANDTIAVNDTTETTSQHEQQQQSKSLSKMHLPLERDLGAVSLWPEVQKLFGHDTELYCLTSTIESYSSVLPSPTIRSRIDDNAENNTNSIAVQVQQGEPTILVASSSKARDAQAASIRIWMITDQFESTTNSNNQNSTDPSTPSTSIVCTQILQGGHKSTVATMSFSSSGKYLISSGKDRRICVWMNTNTTNTNDTTQRSKNSTNFVLGWYKDIAHKRIIWSIHFCPTTFLFNSMFASGSRDGSVKIWSINEDSTTTTSPTPDDQRILSVQEKYNFSPNYIRSDSKKPDSVTAVAFAPIDYIPTSSLLLAIGLESGRIELWTIPKPTTTTGSNTTSVETQQQQQQTVPMLLYPIDVTMCHISSITKIAWRPYYSFVEEQEDNKNNESIVQQQLDKTKKNNKQHIKLQLASGGMDHGCRIFDVILPTE